MKAITIIVLCLSFMLAIFGMIAVFFNPPFGIAIIIVSGISIAINAKDLLKGDKQ